MIKEKIKKIRKITKTQIQTIVYGKQKECNICNHSFHAFLPRTNTMDCALYHEHHIIGAGNRPDYRCPFCNATDRERWLRYVIENHTDVLSKQKKILHFAAEETIYSLLKNQSNIEYYPCDIKPIEGWYRVDITSIPFEDHSFDCIISNHVLEHVEDEDKAVQEIMRVLKKNGSWIFSFPICTDMPTFEDKKIKTPEQRALAYGQKDHVRLYGNDFLNHFEKYGLNLNTYSPYKELDEQTIKRLGLISDDVLIIASFK